jgi:hypothetical protein
MRVAPAVHLVVLAHATPCSFNRPKPTTPPTGHAAGGMTPSQPGTGGEWAKVVDTPGYKAIVSFCFEHGADGSHAPVRAPPVIARGG